LNTSNTELNDQILKFFRKIICLERKRSKNQSISNNNNENNDQDIDLSVPATVLGPEYDDVIAETVGCPEPHEEVILIRSTTRAEPLIVIDDEREYLEDR
jgi:hypothetical protein